MMSPLPSSVADGYQWPSFMSLVLLYVSVTGSKTYESLYPSYPCPPATGKALLPLITSTRPSVSWTCPAQNMSLGVGITLYEPVAGL